jgi:hypothetical protein
VWDGRAHSKTGGKSQGRQQDAGDPAKALAPRAARGTLEGRPRQSGQRALRRAARQADPGNLNARSVADTIRPGTLKTLTFGKLHPF